MIILSETSDRPYPTPSARDTAALTEAARLVGCRVIHIPPTFDQCGSAAGALAHVAVQEGPTPAVWVGFIPSPDRYTAIYEAALAKRIRLLNDPDQFRLAMEFDRFYPLLGDLTPESAVVRDVDEGFAPPQQGLGCAEWHF